MQITFEKSSAVVSPIVVNDDNTMDITYTTNRDKAYRFDITEGELVAVASSTESRAKEFCAAYGCKPIGGHHNLISMSEIDAIYVATPHTSHFELTAQCLKNKKVNFFVPNQNTNLRVNTYFSNKFSLCNTSTAHCSHLLLVLTCRWALGKCMDRHRIFLVHHY